MFALTHTHTQTHLELYILTASTAGRKEKKPILAPSVVRGREMLPRTAGDGKNGRADVRWEESAEAKQRNMEEVTWKIRFSFGVTEKKKKKKMKEEEEGGDEERCQQVWEWGRGRTEALGQVMGGARAALHALPFVRRRSGVAGGLLHSQAGSTAAGTAPPGGQDIKSKIHHLWVSGSERLEPPPIR